MKGRLVDEALHVHMDQGEFPPEVHRIRPDQADPQPDTRHAEEVRNVR